MPKPSVSRRDGAEDRESMNNREKLLRSIKDNINAATDVYGINEVSLDLVREAVASLETEGRQIDGISKKEEVVAKRILRLNPGMVAI